MSERILLLSGPVVRPVIRNIINKLRELDKASSADIQLIISTPGGDLSAGLALIDVMRSLRSDVITVGFGHVASAGAGIIAAGTPGKRFMGPNGYLMTHQPRGGSTNHRGCVDMMESFKGVWAERLAELSHNSVARLEDLNERDSWMTAEQARDNGFIDELLEAEFAA